MTAASLHTIDRRGGPSGAMRWLGLAALAGFAALASQVALAQVGTRLEKVELQPQPGEQVEVRLVLDGPAPQPVTFTIDNPARIAVDLPGTTIALDSRRVDVKAGGVDTIVAAEASGRTRVVFNLDQMRPYETRVDGNTVIVTVGAGAACRRARPRRRRQATTTAAPAGASAIEKVDFRRGADGSGRIIVRTDRPERPGQPAGRKAVASSSTSRARPSPPTRPGATTSSTSPRRSARSTWRRVGAGARIVVAATGDFEQIAYQTDNDYVLELRPRPKTAATPIRARRNTRASA